MAARGRLIFFCAKMAAGKSTLARELAAREAALLLVQDELLEALYPGEILSLKDFTRCATRLLAALRPTLLTLLARGDTVVMDFPANTRGQRAWFRALLDESGAAHELHLIEASDALCKRQLRARSAHLMPGSPWTTEAEFDAVTAWYEPPAAGEGWTLVRHQREG